MTPIYSARSKISTSWQKFSRKLLQESHFMLLRCLLGRHQRQVKINDEIISAHVPLTTLRAFNMPHMQERCPRGRCKTSPLGPDPGGGRARRWQGAGGHPSGRQRRGNARNFRLDGLKGEPRRGRHRPALLALLAGRMLFRPLWRRKRKGRPCLAGSPRSMDDMSLFSVS